MRNRYVQVLQTYWLRPQSSLMAGCLTVCSLVMVAALLVSTKSRTAAFQPMEMWGLACFSFLVWTHLREQLAGERRILLPQYVAPHLIVFVMIAAAFLVGGPALNRFLGGPASCGLLATFVFCFALVGSYALTMSPALMFTGMAAFLGLLVPRWNRLFDEFLIGQYERYAYALLVTSAGAIAVVLARMARLTEEDPLYRQPKPYSAWDVRARVTGEASQSWRLANRGKLFSRSPRFSPALVSASPGLWAGACRWRALSPGNIKGTMLMWAVMLVAVTVPQWAASGSSASSPPALFFFTFLPGGWAAQMYLRQWRFLEADFLRPIDRRSFLKQLGIAIAVHHFQMWFAMASVYVGAVVFFPQIFGTPRLHWILPESFLAQVLVFGMAVSLLRFRSPTKLMLGSAAALTPLMAAITMAAETRFADYAPAVLLACVLFAGIGIILAHSAYRRWLTTELG